MRFEPIVANPDIDVHPDPPGLWQHVAVVCRWKDAKAQRKQWPHAAVIGPLRTVRGLDELARNLLHNPQIRVVLVVGNDLTEGEETTKALLALWKGEPEGERHVGEEVHGPFWDVQVLVQLVLPDEPQPDLPLQEGTAPLVKKITALLVKKIQDERAGLPPEGDALLARWRALAQFPDLPPPWDFTTKPPDYNPQCGHRHGSHGCTNDWCGYGAAPGTFRPASHPSPLAALVPSDQSERPKVTLPPPPPKATATAPSGDPGERVVGETLVDLWPQVLHRAMRFGREAPTQHGPTRELLCLVAVVRDVERSVAELARCPVCGDGPCQDTVNVSSPCPAVSFSPEAKHPVLGITYAQAEAYHRKVSRAEVPEGAPYSYGSRMRGHDLPHKPFRVGSGLDRKVVDGKVVYGPGYKVLYDEDCCEREPSCIRSRGHEGHCDREEWWENEKNLKVLVEENDQIAKLERLLAEKLDTRAAYVTPWRPAEDSGKESGRPCMVGAWWRVEGYDNDPWVVEDEPGYGGALDGDAIVDNDNGKRIIWASIAHCWTELWSGPGSDLAAALEHLRSTGEVKRLVSRDRLHLVVAFRSHDLFAAYPTNLAGILLWQAETAAKLGMRAGTLTVTSYSAHVYERDWNAAEAVIAEHYEKAHREPAWDQRSSWHVELVQPVVEEKPVEVGEVLQIPRPASGVLDTWEVQAEPLPDLYDHVWVENQTTGERRKVSLHDWREKRGDYRGPQPQPTLRATALTPDGREVLGTFEAETPEALRTMCERSGLVTSIGAALWLGDEIRKVAGRV